jgi:hypothetical protein
MKVSYQTKWGPSQSLSEVHTFLGTVGVVQIFIKNFSLYAHPLIKLTQKDEPFVFGPEQIKVQEDLEATLLEFPAFRAITSPCHTSCRHFLHSCWFSTMPM